MCLACLPIVYKNNFNVIAEHVWHDCQKYNWLKIDMYKSSLYGVNFRHISFQTVIYSYMWNGKGIQ